ncbi:amidohydrolase family protein [Sulfurisphaera ohwakuensis]|uniref:Amidohydrolase family protein n=1 Tax=Sulfurisphaera ohwakuensis TaxID=69656 RepID=A0A650CG75_SULOH|nr:amidohydrolase family protein [Sulfurisphaera ohwakuensis]MBB5254192.1 cytosine deaminase [Sulfurisphaera ohwakuensis]QGR16793.1 amidohydrolase family protein [Sulfurisphaera ohwakuensis]
MIKIPAFYDMHSHLENAFIGNEGAESLEEAVEIWSKIRDKMTVDEIKKRIEKAALIELFYGTTHIRVHADTCSKNSVKAAILAKDELKEYIDLQIVAFPEQGIFNCSKEDFVRYSSMVDIIGGKPEADKDPYLHMGFIAELAYKLQKPIDVHIDQHDERTKHSEYMLGVTKTHLALSHLTALHFYSENYAKKLIRMIKEKNVSVISSPLTAFYLNGGNSYPMFRGVTRVKELLRENINVCLGHDDIQNPFYPAGVGDMLQVLWLLMNIEKTFDISWLDLITTNAEKEFGNKNEDYILVDLKDVKELLFTMMPRHVVFRKGKIVAKSTVEVKVLDLNPFDLMRELYRDNLNNSL